MNIKQLNIRFLEAKDEEFSQLVFIKLANSRLYRVISVPYEHKNNTELLELLARFSIHSQQKHGIFFFRMDSDEEMQVVGMEFLRLGVDFVMVEGQMETDPLINNIHPN